MIGMPLLRPGTIWQGVRVMTRTTNCCFFIQLFFFFRRLFTPAKGPQYGHFWADQLFFGRSHMLGGASKKKKNAIRLKKRQKLKKYHRLWDRTHKMVCVIITDFTYGTEEVRRLAAVLSRKSPFFHSLQTDSRIQTLVLPNRK